MIFTKANLGVVDVAGVDKATPMLGWVCFTPEGETVALNAKSAIVVQGIGEEIMGRVPLERSEMAGETVLSIDHVREILRGIERDNLFGGLLECVDIGGDGTARLTNGKRGVELKGSVLGREWLDWRRVFGEVGGRGIVVDAGRLLKMVQVMAKVSDYVELCVVEGRVLFVGMNARTRQGVCGVMSGYAEAEVDFLEGVRGWLKKLFSESKNVGRPLKKLKRVVGGEG